MSSSREQQVGSIRAFAERVSQAVLFDEPSQVLYDIASGKTLPLRLSQLARVEERSGPKAGQRCLVLVYRDGREVALSSVGLCFAPDTRSSGAVRDLPGVVCFRDFRAALDRLKDGLYGQDECPPAREAVGWLTLALAILDGARAAGFDVAREEREVEHQLQELEKRSPRPVGGSPPGQRG
jgi:hypothetical protein